MAIDPRISLAGVVPSNAPALQLFNNALTSATNRGLAQQQEARQAELQPLLMQQQQQAITQGQQAISQGRELNRLTAINETGQRIKPLLESGNIQGAQAVLIDNIANIQARINNGEDLDITESTEALAKLQNGDVTGLLGDINSISSLITGGKGQKQFALQSNAPITDPVTGQVSTPVFNPATGETQLVPIEGAIQETPTQKAARQQQQLVKAADLDVSTTERKETIKKTVARTSALKSEFSEKRRAAARSKRRILEAQKLLEKATQGLTGQTKVQLARIFPGIDAGNEAALTSALKSLALDELQKFKGPTTDFEFRVTEDIAGSLGDGASANKARLASLNRAVWFADKESEQFNNHVKAGHDPDEFFFNFNELVTPKKGGKSYSMQSLQDTAVANHMSIEQVIKVLGDK
jgi:hypothetical protein